MDNYMFYAHGHYGHKTTRHLSNSAPTERANSALVKFGTCQIRHLHFANLAPTFANSAPDFFLIDQTMDDVKYKKRERERERERLRLV